MANEILLEAVRAITEIGDELSVKNRPEPKCEGCEYRMVDLSENRQVCFYKFIENSSYECKVNGNET